jgi:hypothetical protein
MVKMLNWLDNFLLIAAPRQAARHMLLVGLFAEARPAVLAAWGLPPDPLCLASAMASLTT